MNGWTVLLLEEVEVWYLGLDPPVAARVEAAIDALESGGPSLGRPLVDQIKRSRHRNTNELRTGSIRILFMLDPSRQAVRLIAGDKRGAWNSWYQKAVPVADNRYDDWRSSEVSSRPWAKVRAEKAPEISSEQRADAVAALVAEVAAYRLAEIRKGQNRTQSDVAGLMAVGQRRISTIESADLARLEMGTIGSYIQALGGQLKLVADFGDQTVLIQNDPKAPAAR